MAVPASKLVVEAEVVVVAVAAWAAASLPTLAARSSAP